MAKRQSNFVPKTFVRFDLDEKQAAACKKWQPTFSDLDSEMLRLIEAGYKLSFSVDNYNDCYQVFVQTDANIGPNKALIMTGRGSTPLKAMKQAIAKIAACGDEWPTPDLQERNKTEFDD